MFFYYWMIVQVLCENLPISSSGHVALLQKCMMPGLSNSSLENLTQHGAAFDEMLQGINAVIFLAFFFCSWWQLVVRRPISFYSLYDFKIWQHNIVPVILFGLVADGITFLFWYVGIANLAALPLPVGFMITALLLFSMRWAQEKKDINIWSIQFASIVGCMQSVALLPGISRFASTMATLQWLGYERCLAFSVSFLLQWPLIVAGSIKGYCALRSTDLLAMVFQPTFLMAIFVAAIVGYLVLVVIDKIIEKNWLWKFAYYMMLVTIVSMM